MSNEFGLSELYEVVLKTTYPIEIDGRAYKEGEILCVFDNIQLANFNEIKSITAARGGYGNAAHVYWESTREIDLVFSQGIFNHLQFALLCNSKMVYQTPNNFKITKREEVESDETGKFELSETPDGLVFVYDKITSAPVGDFVLEGKVGLVNTPFQTLVVDYTYLYNSGVRHLTLGRRAIEGFLSLEAKTRVKDDISGKTRTGIIKIPKLKLMSDLSMRLGKNANPVVGTLKAKAIPTGERGNMTVMDIFFLDDDIDSDM
jgi:hypothetical protein